MSALRAALAAAVSAALAGPALAGDEAPAPDKTKVLVLPYQAIYRSVPQKKLNSATELLFKELERKDDVPRSTLGELRTVAASPGCS